MILNAYAILAGLVSLAQLAAGLLVVALAAPAWRRFGQVAGPERRSWLEDRGYLLLLLAVLLLVLNVISWPLLYLLLLSYVPEWEGVMCIYGVIRVGQDSVGAPSYLPGLLTLLQVTKPALVFLSGAWLVLYRVNRRTETGPLLGRVMLALIALGTLAAADASAELAYLGIPKKEQSLSGGCCTEALEAATSSKFTPQARLDASQRPWLLGAFYAVNGGIALALMARRPGVPSGAGLSLLALGALLSLAVNVLFLFEIAAPVLLAQPMHHCPYDLVTRVPESVVAVALLVLGGLAVGWGVVAGTASDPETRPFLPEEVDRALSPAAFAYLGGMVMLSLEMALA